MVVLCVVFILLVLIISVGWVLILVLVDSSRFLLDRFVLVLLVFLWIWMLLWNIMWLWLVVMLCYSSL